MSLFQTEPTYNKTQQQAIDAREGHYAVVSGPGSGKCLGFGTPVLMFNGSIKPVQDIQIGDKLMGPDSLPRQVLSLASGIDIMYRLTPTKGDSWTCNGPHILSLKISSKKARKTYGNYVETSINNYKQLPKTVKQKGKLWRTGIDFQPQEVTIDPYFIGLWLGDRTQALKYWQLSVKNRSSQEKCPTFALSSGSSKGKSRTTPPNRLLSTLRGLGLKNNKHIPQMYKINSRKIRLAVLAGILDTDGSYGNGYYDITLKDQQLANDTTFLARSLGFAAYMRPCKKTCTNSKNGPKIGNYFRITISGKLSEIPCRIKRKIAAHRRQIKDVCVTGFKITDEGVRSYYGFEISGDGLFVLGDFTVTHNTKVLISRYSALRQEGVPAEDILAMTFTSRAAKEMRSRAEKAVQDDEQWDKGLPTSTQRPHGFCTFHSLGLAFANLERAHFPFDLSPQPLASAGQMAKYLGVASRRYQLKYKELAGWVSEQKRLGLTPKDVLAIESYRLRLRDAYRDYDSMMRKNGLLDFDDLIFYMAQILTAKEEVRDRWQFRFVFLDECQDADELQLRLVQLISQKHKSVFAVGDGNQAIYEWRSASPKLFLNFHEMFPDTKYIFLGQNYRSSPQIVELVKKLAPVKNELIEAFCSSNPAGPEPQITSYVSETAEAEGVIRTYESGSWGTTAVLARTNAQLRRYEEACASKNIRYHLLGKSGFWQQPEVKHMLAYCQVANAPYDAAIMGALNTPLHPSRFISKQDLKLWLAARGNLSYWEALQEFRSENEQQTKAVGEFCAFIKKIRRYSEMPAPSAISQIMQDLKAMDYYSTEEENPDNDPVENLKQLLKIAQRFDGLHEFLAYCRKVTHASKRTQGLSLGTIHAAKGLQWSTVFIIGCQEGTLPHEKSRNIEEEARLLFVAASRPERNLFISYFGQPSRFLVEAGLIAKPVVKSLQEPNE